MLTLHNRTRIEPIGRVERFFYFFIRVYQLNLCHLCSMFLIAEQFKCELRAPFGPMKLNEYIYLISSSPNPLPLPLERAFFTARNIITKFIYVMGSES